MINYYDGFIQGVKVKLKLNDEEVEDLKEVCRAYGVDWKLEEVTKHEKVV